MRAAVLRAPGVLELEDLPDPVCPNGGALLEVAACAVCGTDVKMLERGHRDLAYPRILGHEIVGRIVEIEGDCGPKEGDLVQLWPGIACGRCIECLRGADRRCHEIEILGFSRDGGFAELLALPSQSIPRGINMLPPNITPEIASLSEPLACCINGQEQANVSKGDSVLIFGAGPVGSLHAMLAEMLGARSVIIAETLENRIRLAEKHTSARVIDPSESLAAAIDMETEGSGVDVILTATPDVKADAGLLKLLAPGGRICIFSGPKEGNFTQQVDLQSLHYHENSIVGAYGCSSRQNTLALELLASGKIRADWIITKRTNLEGIHDALSHSAERIGLKSVICGV
jgi:L-iditol 2-dehydrogenase